MTQRWADASSLTHAVSGGAQRKIRVSRCVHSVLIHPDLMFIRVPSWGPWYSRQRVGEAAVPGPSSSDTLNHGWRGSPSRIRRSCNRARANHLFLNSQHTSRTLFVAVNSGKTCGTESGILHLMEGARANGGVTCAFISEFDAKAREFQFARAVRQWAIYRHWAGPGSFSMAFVINVKMKSCIEAIHWRGRAGAMHLCLKESELFLVGAHLAHGNVFWDSVGDLAQLLQLKPSKARVYFAGDLNVNLLSVLPELCSLDDVDTNEREKLDALSGLVQPYRLCLLVPAASTTPAGGPFSADSTKFPISRVPEGEQCIRQSPACLDFTFVPVHEDASAYLSWHMRPADHAYLHVSIPDAATDIKFEPSTIVLKPWEDCMHWIVENQPIDVATYEQFKTYARTFIQANSSKLSRSMRRQLRIPLHVRNLFKQSEDSTTEEARRHFKSQAVQFLRMHYQEVRAQEARSEHMKGRLLHSVPRLHRITEMVLSAEASGPDHAGKVSVNKSDWQREIEFEFGLRWAANDLHLRTIIKDFLARTENAQIHVSDVELIEALECIKSSNRVDLDGLTPFSIRCLGFHCTSTVLTVIQSVLTSYEQMRSFIIDGQMKGKLASRTGRRDVRAILPLPALLAVCDCIVAKKIEVFLSQLLPCDPHYFAGACKGTQTSDIVFPITLAIEKGLDYFDEAAAAVADVRAYYDSLSPLLIARWLQNRGVPEVICGALMRLHVLPRINVRFGKCVFLLRQRACGVLTGTRTANVVARIPIADACQELNQALEDKGFPTPGGTHVISSWVDNLTSIATNVQDACDSMDLVRAHLQDQWHLDFKDSSMEVISVQPLGVEVFNGYVVKNNLVLLGHFISDDGKLDYPWREVRRRVLAALYSKFRACKLRVLSLDGVAEEINRHLWPVVQFRSNNWPFRKDVAEKMDSLQSHCIAIASCIGPNQDEDVGEYHRRRAKTAGVAAASAGRWSLKWAKQVVAWHNHNLRNTGGLLWGPDVMQVRPMSWLQSLRQRHVPRRSTAVNPFTVDAGRLGTRARRGGPSRRWEDAIGDARAYIDAERLTGILKFSRRKNAQRFCVNIVQTLRSEQLELLDSVDVTSD